MRNRRFGKPSAIVMSGWLLLVLVGGALKANEGEARSPTEQYEALIQEYEQAGGARQFAKQFLELGKNHPDDAVAFEALMWVVKNVRNRTETTQALELLAKQHIDDERLADACLDIARTRSTAAEKLLRAALNRSPHENIRAQACFHLAFQLNVQANVIDQLRRQPDKAPRVLQYYGKEYGAYLAKLDPRALEKKRAQVYERMLADFSDAPVEDGTMGETAEKALFAIRHLSVGKQAPEIVGEDIFGKPFKLSDYRGKVVMLSFWGHW